ncbi:anthranilate phosphoribosyltransferase [Serendipita sp. 411]|nr:anthranilate phosphoribosyltransferase [Serendipita sp. 411]
MEIQVDAVPTAVHTSTHPQHTPETFKPLLSKLISSPSSFSRSDAVLAFEHLLDPTSTYPSQIGSFLTALHLSGREADDDVLAGGAEVLRRHAILVDVPPEQAASGKDRVVVDIVGTGGDGHDTYNVSTTAAIVAAGAGARVYKHGNRASTSSSGSADLLMALGCPLSPPRASSSQQQPPFRFLLAPHHHPLLAPLAPIRRSIPHRSIFNLLGPLVNPSRPAAIVLGVARPELGATFARALAKDETMQRAWVVCGFEGLDEISCAGPTRVWEFRRREGGEEESEGAVDGGVIKEFVVDPTEFGLQPHALETVKGGKGPEENAQTFIQLLDPNGKRDEDEGKLGPIRDFVLMNTAAVLLVAGIVEGLPQGVQLARESIASGRAWDAFCAFREWDRAQAGQ